jgi:hypothetical protein
MCWGGYRELVGLGRAVEVNVGLKEQRERERE